MTNPLIEALVPMDLFTRVFPVTIDLVYASPVHARNMFSRALYYPQARLWLHEDLARIVLRAASRLNRQHKWTLQLKDGLRTVEAQALMNNTDIVKANPQWTAPGEKRLISPPGGGAHPRGMAVDICVLDQQGGELDMGTPFDHFTRDPDQNPAGRHYTALPADILERRGIVEEAFTASAASLGLVVLPLASEWWDYRFPAAVYNRYEPLSDADLPPYMQMTGQPNPIMPGIIQAGFDKKAEDILNGLDENI